MNKLKKVIVGLGVSLALAVGGSVAGSVVTAAPAHAASYSIYNVWLYGTTCDVRQRVNYDWWEETFQGKRDYTYHLYYTYCPNPWYSYPVF